MYQIELDPRALKDMARIPPRYRDRIEAVIDALGSDPRPAGCIPVKGTARGTYRIRVGEYRVVYGIQDAEKKVVVAQVARRREDTYRGLA